jgi:hypothetical protein
MNGRIIRAHVFTTRRHLLAAMLAIGVGAAVLMPLAASAEIKDTDGDGVQDESEIALGTLWGHPDTDGDGLTEGEELYTYGTGLLDVDTDDDGFWDGQEVKYTFTNPLRADTDGDGRSDTQEHYDGTDPRVPDAVPAPADPRRDGPYEEPPADPAPPAEPAPEERPDRDGDGLYDDDETVDGINAEYGTDPDLFDTDGDGRGDGEEVYYGTDPTVYD